ncbi:VOC family protein [Arthrobacter sp. B0490]|uniref:VOC family protein n=1 Tax=Arthrobacter sp. B0490 TaxID=2058891 RepID=UPI000CE3A24E|nr:VOC family protein [Arthrobacter sp. B0490]
MTTDWTITIDCHDAVRLASFWKTALAYVDAPPPAGFATWREWYRTCDVPEDEWDDVATLVDPHDVLPRITFLRVPEGKAMKNRLHLDLQVGGGRATPAAVRRHRIMEAVEKLVAAGASVLEEHALGPQPDHVVLLDPEGNEFCVV